MAISQVTNEQSTHHLILTSSATGDTVPLNLVDGRGKFDPLSFERDLIGDDTIKIATGQEKYGDMDYPYEHVSQEDWSGGRGSEDFDKDSTKFLDSNKIDTLKDEEFHLAGLDIFTQGYRTGQGQKWYYRDGTTGTRYTAFHLYSGGTGTGLGTHPYVGDKIPYDASFSLKYLYFYAMFTDTSVGDLTVYIFDRDGTEPGAAVGTTTVSTTGLKPYRWYLLRASYPIAVTITSPNTYYAVFYSNGTSAIHWRIMSTADPNDLNEPFRSFDGATWFTDPLNNTNHLMIRATAADTPVKYFFFKYKGALFALSRRDDGNVSKLYINGDQGVATNATGAQSSTTLRDTTKSWGTDDFKGSIVQIVKGTGSAQPQPWRLITGNTSNTLTVSPAWDVTPAVGATGSEYVIVASDKWTEVDTTSAQPSGAAWTTQVVTDVLVVAGAVYIAQGDSVAMDRLVRYNNAGVWTTVWATESGVGTYLKNQADAQGNYVWIAKGGYPSVIGRAATSDWTAGTGGATLDFTVYPSITVGDPGERITGLAVYGDYGSLWVLKEGSVWEIWDGTAVKKSTDEMQAAEDFRTGRSPIVHGSYLYFPWMGSVLRYFRQLFDRVGPDREDIPFPSDRYGSIVAMAGYPGVVLAAVDGGSAAKSTVLAYKSGWVEMFRSPDTSMRVQNVFVQHIPGDHVDRLWISCGADIIWTPISIDPANHPQVDYNFYPFAPGGTIEMSPIYNGMNAVQKFYKSVSVQSRNHYPTTVTYSTDDGGTWHLAGDDSIDAYAGELILGNNDAVGYSLSVAVTLETTLSNQTPRVKAVVVKGLKRFSANHYVAALVLLADNPTDRKGNPELPAAFPTALSKYNALIEMEESPYPVSVSSMIRPLDARTAFVVKVKVRPERIALGSGEAYLCDLLLYEV